MKGDAPRRVRVTEMNILIADDHEMIVEDLKDEIGELMPDALCIGTTDPGSIMPLFRQYRFNIVFMDIEMPGANGIRIAKNILDEEPLTNIIYITGYTRYAAQSYQTYASAFLEKPITTEMLSDALAHLRHPVSDITDEMIEREYAGKAVIGKKIEKWREERGMSRQEFADALSVEVRTVYRWESAERTPDIATYMKILQVLGKSKYII